MKTTTTGEITVDEIKEAIVFFLKKKKGIDVKDISFGIAEENDPDDWQGRFAPTSVLSKAMFTLK